MLSRHFDFGTSMYTGVARNTFLRLADHLADWHDTKVIFRNTNGKPLRGTIQVEIDGFYYYVELYTEA